MRGFLIVVGIGLFTIVGYLLFQGRQSESLNTEKTSGGEAASVSAKPIKSADRSPTEYGPEDHLPDRVVGADRIPVPDINSARLERLPPREPLSEPVLRTSDKSGKQLLHRPVANIAGVIEAQGYSIEIAGIETIPPEFVCRSENEAARPCGKQALTAFRGWLRGRAIECDLGDGEASEQIRAHCSLAGKDAGSWLVENGWAYAQAGSKYITLETEARKKGLGVFAAAE